MELTKKQAIEEHRKMWNWIADAIKDKEDYLEVVSRYGWDSLIVKLKYHYLLNYKGQKYKDIRARCFCCEYADNTSNGVCCGNDICRYCPVIWSGSTGRCCDEYGEYEEFTSLYEYSDENKEKAYKLALKIANLPEREGV